MSQNLARVFGQKLATTMLPNSFNGPAPPGLNALTGLPTAPATQSPSPNALDTYNAYGALKPNSITGALPQYDSSRGGAPLTNAEIAGAQKSLPITKSTRDLNLGNADERGVLLNRIADRIASSGPVKATGRFYDSYYNFASRNPLSRASVPGVEAGFWDRLTDPKNADRPFSAAVEGVIPPAAQAAAAGQASPPTDIMGALRKAYNKSPLWTGAAGAGIGALGLYGAYNMMRKRRQRQQSQFSRARYPQIIN